MTLWVSINTQAPAWRFDEYPFPLLSVLLALEAVLLTSCVLIRQNIADRAFERRNHLDLQINLLAEREATLSLSILQRIAEHLRCPIGDEAQTKNSPTKRRSTLSRETSERAKKSRMKSVALIFEVRTLLLVFSYGIGTLHVSRDFLLTAVLSASVLSFFSIPFFGHLSDQIGRKNVYMAGAVVTGIFGFVYFAMLNTGSATIIFLAIILSLIPHDMLYGPQAALIAESFTGRLRYSGSSLGYQLASVIAGGPAPLIATWLFGTFHSATAIAVYIAVCAVITLVATAMMTDYTGKDINAADAHVRRT